MLYLGNILKYFINYIFKLLFILFSFQMKVFVLRNRWEGILYFLIMMFFSGGYILGGNYWDILKWIFLLYGFNMMICINYYGVYFYYMVLMMMGFY